MVSFPLDSSRRQETILNRLRIEHTLMILGSQVKQYIICTIMSDNGHSNHGSLINNTI